MMILAILSGLLAAVLLCIYVTLRLGLRRHGPFLVDSYLLGLVLYASGSVALTLLPGEHWSPSVATMAMMALASSLGMAIIILSARLRFSRFRNLRDYVNAAAASRLELQYIYVAFVVSCFVSLLFMYAVVRVGLASALFMGLMGVDGASFLEVRKSITSGTEGYLAPGYVKQFRDVLLSITCMAILLARPWGARTWPLLFGVPLALGAMLVAGQRTPFAVLVLALMLGVIFAGWMRQRSFGVGKVRRAWLRGLLFTTAFLSLFTGMTYLLGRVEAEADLAEMVGRVVLGLVERVVVMVPRENMATHPFWASIGPTYGASWAADLAGIVPGTQYAFSNELHFLLGGSELGNAPLGLPADAWLAWGWVGVLVLPWVYVLLLFALDSFLVRHPSPLSIATRAYLAIMLPFIYSPFLFILYGGVVALGHLLILFGIRAIRRSLALPPSPVVLGRQRDERILAARRNL